MIKLSAYAKKMNVTYRTAQRWWYEGMLKGVQLPTGTILIEDDCPAETKRKGGDRVAVYARVSSSQNKSNLESQAARLLDYCAAKGYSVAHDVREVGSGVNDQRKKLSALLEKSDWDVLVVEHKDRLTRFGFNHMEQLLRLAGRRVEVINSATDREQDLTQDLVAVVTSFCARLYGQRRCRRKTEQIIRQLQEEGHSVTSAEEAEAE